MASPGHYPNTTGIRDIELQEILADRPDIAADTVSLTPPRSPPTAIQAWYRISRTIRKALTTALDRKPGAHERDLWLAASELQYRQPQFWMDYTHLRYRPDAPITSLFHLVVKRIVPPPGGLSVTECYPRDETCLSDWLESVYETLVAQSSDSLIIW